MAAKKKSNNPEGISDPELDVQLRATLELMLKEQAVKNVPRVFRNELCVKVNQFIHKYPDGTMFLIEQDQNDSSETILRKL